ncbi:MAG: hypothetical protein GVY18_15495 [Bacteroidetes bacterium]|jgi:hypothetical protein|nr:hypothetical protein [Bacteroidota bacterium]
MSLDDTTRTVEVDCPAAYINEGGALLVQHEEEAIIWVWAYPDLYPWPHDIAWLYAPVTGKRRWPGDLWGIDETGDLLIIECKRRKSGTDPFVDFLPYHAPNREELTAAHWQKKWAHHHQKELSFPNGVVVRPSGKTAGLLPRSSKRAAIRRWPRLVQRVDAQIRSDDYTDKVHTYLQRRADIGNPCPHYVGLLVTSDPDASALTPGWTSSAHELQKRVRDGRVHVVWSHAHTKSSGRLVLTMQVVPASEWK